MNTLDNLRNNTAYLIWCATVLHRKPFDADDERFEGRRVAVMTEQECVDIVKRVRIIA